MLKQNRNLWRYLLFSWLTFGIYSIVFYNDLNKDLNQAQRKYGKKQMSYYAAFLLGLITFGIVPLIWKIKLTIRLYQQARTDKLYENGNLAWNLVFKYAFGWTIVCPIISLFWDIKNSNEICKYYNREYFEKLAPEFKEFPDGFEIIPATKVIHRHNFGNNLSGIILMLIGLLPLLFLFLPIYQMKMAPSSDVPNITTSFRLELFDIVKSIYTRNPSNLSIFNDADIFSKWHGTWVFSILIEENVYAILFWYICIIMISGLTFFQGFMQVIRGKLALHMAPVLGVFVSMFLSFAMLVVTARLGGIYRLGCFLGFNSAEYAVPGGYSFSFILPIIYAVLSTFAFFAYLVVYIYAFAGKYYREDIEVVETPTEEGMEEIYRRAVYPVVTKSMTVIDDHTYYKNTVIETANIEDGVVKLGVGAFSNCLKLHEVNIPTSVQVIEANCFFHCPALSDINYAGTKEEWSRIERGSNWLANSGTNVVECKDGLITVDPYC